jgi:hypothetical protein
MPSPSHSSRFYHPNNSGWAVQILSSTHHSVIYYAAFSTPLLPCPPMAIPYRQIINY